MLRMKSVKLFVGCVQVISGKTARTQKIISLVPYSKYLVLLDRSKKMKCWPIERGQIFMKSLPVRLGKWFGNGFVGTGEEL